MKTKSGHISIAEIRDQMENNTLIANHAYQRAPGLWPNPAKSYFIDTIVNDFPFQSVYIHEYVSKQTKKIRKDIVDGQQRLTTIRDYLNDEFPLGTSTRLYPGKRFSQLDEDAQDAILAYSVPVITISQSDQNEILEMFRRMKGLLSVTWQSWGGFCRSVALKSCTGTVTRGGVATVAIADVTDGARLGYIAKSLSRNEVVRAGKSLAPHQEPTWGDVSLVLDVVRYLRPTNESSLAAGLLTATRAPSEMRVVRNAAAHITSSTLLDVDRLKIFYVGAEFAHPLDLLAWRTRDTSEYVYPVWLAELLSMADVMTS